MKRHLMNQIKCLLVASLLLFGTVPCQAMSQPAPPEWVTSMEGLLAWYGELTGDAPQECAVSKPIVSTGEVVLSATPCRKDIILFEGLRIPAGARLTVDNPNLVLMGWSPAITVEPGGVLHIRRWHALTAQSMPQGGIVVQAGGTLLMETGITLPVGVVIDNNPPPNNILPPTNDLLPPTNDLLPPTTTSPPETPDGTSPPETPDETPAPEKPPAEEKLSVNGHVLKVSVSGTLLAMLTLPRVDPAHTETVTIERSADAQTWNTEYIFRWDENALGFMSNDTPEFGRMASRTRYDGSKTDFRYLARLSGKPFYLRVTLTATDGQQTVSDEIPLTEPPVGYYPGSDDFEESDGNRGGGGQGTTDREEQKKPAVSHSRNTLTTEPQIKTRISGGTTSAQAPAVSSIAPQANAPTAQSLPEPQPALVTEDAALPAPEPSPEQSGQAAMAQSKPLASSAQNWLVIAATLVLCCAIWIFTTKRKKS